MYLRQSAFAIRCEWGPQGIEQLAARSDAIVIVDVLSFTTCIDIAVGRGAIVYPYRWRDESSVEFARSVGAVLAGPRRDPDGFSLSPASLQTIPPGTRLVLPSPNGATLSLATGSTPTLAGCLRNATALAEAAARMGSRISVIASGERWPDGTLRPSVEDLVGAGAIISHLPGSRSPEAEVAVAAFQAARSDLRFFLSECISGRELIERGFTEDVLLAAEMDVSAAAPLLANGAYSALK